MTNEEITKALEILVPKASWSLLGDDYDEIQWNSKSAKPSLEVIESTIANLPELEAQEKAKKDAEIAFAKTQKEAVLAKLGLTAQEAVALLG